MPHILRRVLLSIVLALTPGLALASDDLPGEADRGAIREVIGDQIAAFRADDGERAFSFASPDIRQKFGDAQTFMAMVRHGYAPVYRPQSFDFARLVRADGKLFQLVRIVGPDGRRLAALYQMEKQEGGRWLIAGCVLLDKDDDTV